MHVLSCSFSSTTPEVFAYLDCVSVGDAEVAVYYPALDCGSSGYYVGLGITYTLLVFWVLGVPVAMLVLLLHLRKQQRLQEVPVMQRWGFLYGTYRPRYFWFEVLLLSRRIVLGQISAWLLDRADLRSALLAVSTTAFLLLHMAVRPYVQSHANFLETVSLVTLTILCNLTSGHSLVRDGAYSVSVQVIACVLVLLVAGALLLAALRSKLSAIRRCVQWASTWFGSGEVEARASESEPKAEELITLHSTNPPVADDDSMTAAAGWRQPLLSGPSHDDDD